MGGVIIYEPEEDSDVNEFPWTVTFEPSGGDDWDSFICGPYERDHAVALAEAVALDDAEGGVLAIVKPMLPALVAPTTSPPRSRNSAKPPSKKRPTTEETVNGTARRLRRRRPRRGRGRVRRAALARGDPRGHGAPTAACWTWTRE